jgi:hypothetical protein
MMHKWMEHSCMVFARRAFIAALRALPAGRVQNKLFCSLSRRRQNKPDSVLAGAANLVKRARTLKQP